VKFAAESCPIRVIGFGVQVRMQRTCSSPEGITHLIDRCRGRDAEVRSRFVEGHAIAVR
jgi:hypothetical protein